MLPIGQDRYPVPLLPVAGKHLPCELVGRTWALQSTSSGSEASCTTCCGVHLGSILNLFGPQLLFHNREESHLPWVSQVILGN